MLWLRSFSAVYPESAGGYPYSLPLFSSLKRMEFTAPITFLTGENGCGKTTLIELMAQLTRAVRVDGENADAKQRKFAHASGAFRAVMSRKPDRCFYFHAEGFVRYTDRLSAMRAEAQRSLDEMNAENPYGSEYARMLARMPHAGALSAIERQYEHDITARSHGESFLDFFGGRLTPNGLFLLDEPEAALSYENQYVLTHMLRQYAAQNCQFIICTHSPILPAIPEAQILSLDDGAIRPIAYNDLPGVRFLRDFLAAPQRYCRPE